MCVSDAHRGDTNVSTDNSNPTNSRPEYDNNRLHVREGVWSNTRRRSRTKDVKNVEQSGRMAEVTVDGECSHG